MNSLLSLMKGATAIIAFDTLTLMLGTESLLRLPSRGNTVLRIDSTDIKSATSMIPNSGVKRLR